MSLALSLLMLINSQRINPLTLDAGLNARAQSRAQFLCETHTFSHDYWKYWLIGIDGFAAENLAEGYTTASDIHTSLMASKEHRLNIVNTRYHYLGVGSACGITVELFIERI